MKVLIFLLFIYVAITLFLYLNQRNLIYFPSSLAHSTAAAGVPEMQVVTLQTADGLDLKAWYRPVINPQSLTIVYFHGNGGSISHRGRIIKPFLKDGYGVLLVTYRGYSGNPGNPSEEGLYQDARAAIQFLHKQNVSDSCIVLYGESLGTAVAVQMATEYPVGGLILQSPFTSLGEVGQFHYPFFPVKWLVKDRFNSLSKVKQIHAPTFILYGQNDDIVPSKFSVQLFEALSPPKQIKPISDIGHNDPFDFKFAISFMKEFIKCEPHKN